MMRNIIYSVPRLHDSNSPGKAATFVLLSPLWDGKAGAVCPCTGPVDTRVQFCTHVDLCTILALATVTKPSPASLVISNEWSLRCQTTLVWSWIKCRVQYYRISLNSLYLWHHRENSHIRKRCFSCCFHTLRAAVPGKDHEQDLTQETLVSVPAWTSDTWLSPTPGSVSGKDHLLLFPWTNDQQWTSDNTSQGNSLERRTQ